MSERSWLINSLLGGMMGRRDGKKGGMTCKDVWKDEEMHKTSMDL